MVEEISQLAESECNVTDFYQGFLTRVTSALASVGGAIWRTDEEGAVRLEYHINLADSGLTREPEIQQPHSKLLLNAMEAAEPMLVPPTQWRKRRGGGRQSDSLSPGDRPVSCRAKGRWPDRDFSTSGHRTDHTAGLPPVRCANE